MDYSITYRPKELTDELKDTFIEVLKKISSQYYIGYESADTTKAINHLQCHIRTETKYKTNNLRRAIKKLNESMEYTPTNLKIKEITETPLYQLGYCMKEGKGCVTNYPESILKEAHQIASTTSKSMKKVKIGKEVVTTDSVLRAFVKWVEDNQIKNPSVTLARRFCGYLWRNKEINWNTYCKMNFKEMDYFITDYFSQEQYEDNFEGVTLLYKGLK